MLTNINWPYYYFIFARVIGLLSKPFILWFLLTSEQNVASEDFSQFYLILGSFFMLLSVPVHSNFYRNFYNKESRNWFNLARLYREYLVNITTHVAMVLLPFMIISPFFITDKLLLTLFIIFFLIEKIFDEIQRHMQFEKDFTVWSNLFLIKNTAPVFFIIFLVFLENNSLFLGFLLFSIALTSLLLSRHIDRRLFKIFPLLCASIYTRMRRYLVEFKREYLKKYLFGLFNANAHQIDKWMYYFFDLKAKLAEIMLVGQIGNAMTIGSSYATVSGRRADFVNNCKNIKDIFSGMKTFIVSSILFIFGIAVIYSGAYQFAQIQISTIFLTLFAYFFFSLSQPLLEYVFWNVSDKHKLLIDIFYFLFFIALLFLISNFVNDISLAIAIDFFIYQLMRLLSFLFIASRLLKIKAC